MIDTFFKSGQVAYLALAVMLIESCVFARLFRQMPVMIYSVCAGAFMVLALWAALTDLPASVIGMFMICSFVFHVMEIVQWRSIAKRLPQ
jgi:hypothetical protein